MAGTQSIERALRLIRLVGERNEAGCSLKEAAEETGLNPTTAHRMLQLLVAEKFLEFQKSSRRYFLGIDFFRLGNASFEKGNITDIARPIMVKLADQTGDTVFFSVRSGHHSVCIARVEGNYPIKALTLSLGSRRPLGIGAGSLALLAVLPEAECEAAIAANREEISLYPGYDRDVLMQLVKSSRTQGHSVNDGRVIRGMSAFGVAIRNGYGEPVGAISIAAISQRMKGAQGRERLMLLKAAAQEIRKQAG